MLPKTMKAVVSDGNGGVELNVVNVPVPGPDEVLVKIVAAAQNPADCMGLTLFISVITHCLAPQGGLFCCIKPKVISSVATFQEPSLA